MNGSQPGLYGLNKTNRRPQHFWSKNRFNSSFPIALCCYLRDRRIPVLCVYASNGATEVRNLDADQLFGLMPQERPYFAFEQAYRPYSQLCIGERAPVADVVIYNTDANGDPDQPRRALEIKLTVVPDSTSGRLDPRLWGPELVFRPPTLHKTILGLYVSASPKRDEVRAILRPTFLRFGAWPSLVEAVQNRSDVLRSLAEVVDLLEDVQRPLIMQPIWRTQGKHILADQAFDVFAWTDVAFLRLVIDAADPDSVSAVRRQNQNVITRPQRAAIQIFRALYQLSSAGEIDREHLFNEMGYDLQNDKAFSLSGRKVQPYLNHQRLIQPAIPKTALRDLILGNGRDLLSPERRLDASIYFTWAEMFGSTETPPDVSDDESEPTESD